MSFELNIFINKMQRLPFPKVQEMLKENEKEFFKLSYTNQSAVLNFMEKRYHIREQIDEKEMMFLMLLFADLSQNRG